MASSERSIQLGGSHCCTCSRVCHHIGGPYDCGQHAPIPKIVPPRDILAEMRDLADKILAPYPRTLRVGPGVAKLLRAIAPPSTGLPIAVIPLGVDIVPDDTLTAGQWRVLDQNGNELRSGQVDILAGMPADVQVLTSPYLPDGVEAIAIAPTSLHPDDPGYPPIERRAAIIVREPAPSTTEGGGPA